MTSFQLVNHAPLPFTPIFVASSISPDSTSSFPFSALFWANNRSPGPPSHHKLPRVANPPHAFSHRPLMAFLSFCSPKGPRSRFNAWPWPCGEKYMVSMTRSRASRRWFANCSIVVMLRANRYVCNARSRPVKSVNHPNLIDGEEKSDQKCDTRPIEDNSHR